MTESALRWEKKMKKQPETPVVAGATPPAAVAGPEPLTAADAFDRCIESVSKYCSHGDINSHALKLLKIYYLSPAALPTPAPAASPERGYRLRSLIAKFSDLAVEMEKHSNDHIHDESPDNLGAAVEGVCADRINAILKAERALAEGQSSSTPEGAK